MLPLEFWWQQGIKNCQLDMLIFVQVYKTIDKILYLYKVLEEQKRAKESTKRKLEASEEKCSWSDDVIRSKFVRSASSEARSLEVKNMIKELGIWFDHV